MQSNTNGNQVFHFSTNSVEFFTFQIEVQTISFHIMRIAFLYKYIVLTSRFRVRNHVIE